VLVSTQSKETRTDSLGRFSIASLPAARHFVRIRKLGYAVQLLNVTTTVTTVARFRVVMDPIGTQLAQVDVRADYAPSRLTGFYNRIATLAPHLYLTREQILAQKAVSLTQLLATIRGVSVRLNERAQPVVYWRDGCVLSVVVNTRLMEFDGTMMDTMLRPDELAGIEVYPSGNPTPAEYTFVRGRCGAIVGIWTR
jgi:hypothetical protein